MFFIVLLQFYSRINALENCNNTVSNSYIHKLFHFYDQAETKDQQRSYARQILGFAAVNSWQLNSSQLNTLKSAYNLHGAVIFPGLLQKEKILLSNSHSPSRHISYRDVDNPVIVQCNDLQVVLEVFQDSLQFSSYVKKNLIASFNKTTTGFIDVELQTFFKDAAWHACVYSYNTQVRHKDLFVFFSDGSYMHRSVPENFNEKKFSLNAQGLLHMTCDVKYEELEGGKYCVDVQYSKVDTIEKLKKMIIPSVQFNPHNAMNLVFVEQKEPVLVWVDQHLFVENLESHHVEDLGPLQFSSISKVSFSNNGRIVWIEGCEQGKDVSYGSVQAWSLKNFKRERYWGSSIQFARNYIFSPNGVFGLALQTSNKKNHVYLCDASNGCIVAQFKLDKQVYEYSFKTNSEIIINCGNDGWYTINIAPLQMANWLAATKSFREVASFLTTHRNDLFQNLQNDNTKHQVIDLP
jgi:hypothetical protein